MELVNLRVLQRKYIYFAPHHIKEPKVFRAVRLGHMSGFYTFMKDAKLHTVGFRVDFKQIKARQKARVCCQRNHIHSKPSHLT